ncbi:MAG TPA: uroporphyrinogen-III synthase [Acidimicrobiia bacterium]|nr:uroporphyrinogen-III synthase [Acidimicrobiia bacterium]
MTQVALTTDRFDRVVPLYMEAGLDAIGLPCVRVEPASDDVMDLAREAAVRAGVLILSSARTVDWLWPQGPLPSVDVIAVGTATANTVRERGGRVVLTGNSGLAELAATASTRLATSRVVFPRSADTDPAVLRLVRDLTPNLVEFEVYRVQAVAPQNTEVQAVAFASPSAVVGWHLSRNLTGLVVGVIGATTAAAVSRHRQPDVVASSPTHRALAQALASHMEVTV